jgi:uncharacterized protein YidB (DUF937 family)
MVIEDANTVAASWISKGPNQPVAPHQLEQAIPPDVRATLAEQTGLSREEILSSSHETCRKL